MIVGLRQIKFATQNRLHALLLHRVEEVDRAIDIPMIGHRRSRLADLAQMPGKLIDITSAIKKGVVRMKM